MSVRIGAELAGFTLEDVSPATRERARDCLLDTLGCLVAGSRLRSTDVLRRAAGDWAGSGVDALFGGTAAHSVEMDDFHNAGTVHPGVVVVPAALEATLAADRDGGTLLEAVLLGYETAIRVGLSTEGTLYDRGFHPTSAAGVFGACAAAAHALGLDADAMDDAFGIAGSQAGGLLEYKSEGAWTKRLQVGMASETGARAATLAAAGFSGPSTILEGTHGFLRAYADRWDLDPLSSPWSFDSIREVAHKPYGCCRFVHPALDAFSEAAADLDATPESIEAIEVTTHQQAIASTGRPAERRYRPERTVDAQFSLPFTLGVAAVHDGTVLPRHLAGDALADRVDYRSSDRFTARFPQSNGARVAVATDRERAEVEVTTPRGDPENPLTRADLVAKFESLVGDVLDDPDATADAVLSLAPGDDVGALADLLPRR
jgi:2-methylcitrate dehydratase PrpD